MGVCFFLFSSLSLRKDRCFFKFSIHAASAASEYVLGRQDGPGDDHGDAAGAAVINKMLVMECTVVQEGRRK